VQIFVILKVSVQVAAAAAAAAAVVVVCKTVGPHPALCTMTIADLLCFPFD
jgi:hypothetical protein